MNSATVMQTLNTGFSFQQENYDYDSSGNLNLLKIESIDLSLVKQNEFAATGSGSFYSCTVSLCRAHSFLDTRRQFSSLVGDFRCIHWMISGAC